MHCTMQNMHCTLYNVQIKMYKKRQGKRHKCKRIYITGKLIRMYKIWMRSIISLFINFYNTICSGKNEFSKEKGNWYLSFLQTQRPLQRNNNENVFIAVSLMWRR